MLEVKSNCTGCGLCSVLCPTNCIKMQEDAEGFRYPEVCKEDCIRCGLCISQCPLNCGKKDSDIVRAFAAKNRNGNTRIESSSGGIFTALAEKFILDGGILCAAKYNESFAVVHSLADNLDDIAQYRGAKYSQSSAEMFFEQLRHLLENDTPVLFVGTPCQIAAFRTFLEDRIYDNLLLVDMICHGVPSPMVWKRYCEERRLIDVDGIEIKHINLRNKDSGWSRYKYSVEFIYENGKTYKTLQEKDSFMRGFVNNLYLRPSCSDCNFKDVNRQSDLTIGDFWGIWEKDSDFDDDQGVSALIVNTEKGERCWNSISELFDYKEVDIEDIIAFNPSLLKPSMPHPKRGDFFCQVQDRVSLIKLIEDCLTPPTNTKTRLIGCIMRKIGMCK